jgi:hypothetical protein
MYKKYAKIVVVCIILALSLLWLFSASLFFPPPPVPVVANHRVLNDIYGCYRYDGRLVLVLAPDGLAHALGPAVPFSVVEIRRNLIVRPERRLAAIRLPDASYAIKVVDGHPAYLDFTLGPPTRLTVMSQDRSLTITLEKGACPS